MASLGAAYKNGFLREAIFLDARLMRNGARGILRQCSAPNLQCARVHDIRRRALDVIHHVIEGSAEI